MQTYKIKANNIDRNNRHLVCSKYSWIKWNNNTNYNNNNNKHCNKTAMSTTTTTAKRKAEHRTNWLYQMTTTTLPQINKMIFVNVRARARGRVHVFHSAHTVRPLNMCVYTSFECVQVENGFGAGATKHCLLPRMCLNVCTFGILIASFGAYA